MRNRGLDPNLYTEEYYLTNCAGFDEFKKTKGEKLDPRLKKALSYAKVRSGMRVLDVGCGRGELVFWAARQGARAIGIDYSKVAIRLAKKALKTQGKEVKKKAKFLVKNAKEMDFESESFDWIFLTDVLEHLYPEEQEVVLDKIYKILKKGGKIIARTEPNRIYVDFIYPYWCYPISSVLIGLWNKFLKKNYIDIPPPTSRTKYQKAMHINEPTYFGLRRLFNKHKLETRIITKVAIEKPIISWKDRVYNLIVCFLPFSRYFPLNILFANDFTVIAKKV